MNTYGHYKPDAYEVVLFSTAEVKIAQDRSDDGKKTYFMMTWDDLFENIKTNANLYEIICADQPRKFYLDFDGPRDELEKLKYTEESIIEHLTKRIRIFLRTSQFKDAPFDTTEINFLSSHTEKKISFHISIPAVVFANHKESKTMHLMFLEHNRDDNDPIVKFCDEAVYSMNRLWRLPFQSKINKDQILTICEGSTNYKDHIVTYTCDVPPQDVKWAMKTEEEPEKPIEFELTTENMDKARTCIKLIYDYVLDKKHSLCDETSGLIEYAKWKNLAFASLNCTNNDEEVFKLIFPLYRNNDPSKCDYEYINMARNASNYPYTIGTLIHYAQENPDYDELYGEEPIKKLLPKLVEEIVEVVDEDEEAFVYQDDGSVVKLEETSDITKKKKYLIAKSRADQSTLYLQNMQYYSDLCTIDMDKIYHANDLKLLMTKCIKVLVNSGEHLAITIDKEYIEHRKRFEEKFKIIDFSKVKKGLFKYVKIVNPYFESTPRKDYAFAERMLGEVIIEHIPIGLLSNLITKNQLQTYRKIVFEPYFDVPPNNDDCFNLFTGFPYQEDFALATSQEIVERSTRYANSKMKKHQDQCFCNNEPEKIEYYHKSIARILQKPKEISSTFIVLKSDHGIGKDTNARFNKEIIGEKYTLQVGSLESLFTSFNDVMEGKLLIFINEIKDKGNHFDKHEKLKDFITRENMTINKKYTPEYVVDVHYKLFGHTNNDSPLHIEPTDRRIVIYDCSNYVDDVCVLNNQAYFTDLYETELLDPEFIKDASFYYMSLNIDGFNPRDHPKNKFVDAQKIESLNRVEKFICYASAEGGIDTWPIAELRGDKLYYIRYQDLFDQFRIWCNEVEHCDDKLTKTKFKSLLTKLKLEPNRNTIRFKGVPTKNLYAFNKELIEANMRKYLKIDDFTVEMCL